VEQRGQSAFAGEAVERPKQDQVELAPRWNDFPGKCYAMSGSRGGKLLIW
jgi:hypothetical protein